MTKEVITNIIEIDAKYGDGTPYNQFTMEAKAKFYLNSAATSMLEAGKYLLLLKEHEPHGGFMESLERIGLEYRTANRLMSATLKFSNMTALSHFSMTKLYELTMLDDDTLQALNEGETVAGLTLDNIDKMTTRELKEELRRIKQDAQEDKEATDRLLQDKDHKITSLSKQLKKIDTPEGWIDIAKDAIVSINTIHGEYVELHARLLELANTINTLPIDRDDAKFVGLKHLRHIVEQIASSLQPLVDEIGVDVTPIQMVITSNGGVIEAVEE